MRYKKLKGIILKKQNFKEADQVVTIWTRQAGKVRVVGKGLRLAKSKLAFSMQELAEVEFETAGRHGLPQLISAKVLGIYPGVRGDLAKTAAGFYAMELMLKMTADEQPNPPAYDLLLDLLGHLERQSVSATELRLLLDHFSLRFLEALGFSIEFARGSFDLPEGQEQALVALARSELPQVQSLFAEDLAKRLHATVRNFIEFIMERSLKSEPFLMRV